MFASKLFLLVAVPQCIYLVHTQASEDAPVPPPPVDELNDTVPQDLYVIRTVVYEVGILTDAANDTRDLDRPREQVDVTIFDRSQNGSGIDLSSIPLPIQTNISGVSVTGLIPGAGLASILLPPVAQEQAPVLPAKQVTVTQNISTTDPDRGSEIISNLPKLLGLTTENKSSDNRVGETSTEKNEEQP